MEQQVEYTRQEVLADVLPRLTGEEWTYRRFQNLVATGKAPVCVKRGRSTYYRPEDIEAWVAQHALPLPRWEWVTRRQVAPLLRCKWQDLAAMATYGAGPPYRVIGRDAYYHVPTALRWQAEHQKRKPRQ